jgi:sugar fermentation stimulation protein A
LKFFGPTQKATYLDRPNRFTLVCRLNGKKVKAFLPNPGRLWELLLPGVTVYLEKASNQDRKLHYTVVAIQRENHPVMVHTHRTNDLVDHLLRKRLIPGLEDAKVVRREVKHGRSRFDFLLERKRKEIFLEVKSCTLFGRRVAMFPDAVTARGKRHVEELVELSTARKSGAVVFLICWPKAEFFMPEYHTDLQFSRTLLSAKDKISIIPLAVEMGEDLSLASRVRTLEIPWGLVEREAENRGSYILILRLPARKNIEIGKLGRLQFKAGYYLYAGSAQKSLTQRLERHRRERKNLFWHVDYLRAQAEFHWALPIRTGDDLECELASALRKIAGWEVPGFGSSDCSCDSHLFGMTKDPLHSPEFIALLQYFRMDRLFTSSP